MTTKKDLYQVEIKIMGKTFKSTGKTVAEAILKLNVGKIQGVGIMTVKHGDKSKERILMQPVIERFLNSRGLTQEIAVKGISNLFANI